MALAHSEEVMKNSNEDISDDSITMNRCVKRNLGVMNADVVLIQPFPNIVYGKRVHILPFDDEVEGLTGYGAYFI